MKQPYTETEKERERVLNDPVPPWAIREFRGMLSAIAHTPLTEMAEFVRKHQEMPYAEFLKTRYWMIIRGAVLARDRYACKRCGRLDDLRVHHRTYEHRGMEYAHMGDLATLCKACHTLVHFVDLAAATIKPLTFEEEQKDRQLRKKNSLIRQMMARKHIPLSDDTVKGDG